MFKKRFLVALTGLLGISANAVADVEPDFSYVEAGMAKQNFDNSDFSPVGFNVGTSVVFSDALYGIASFTSTSDDIQDVDIDLIDSSVGFGVRFAVSNLTAVYSELRYETKEVEFREDRDTGKVDGDGYSLAVGMRTNLTESLELDGKVAYMDVEGETDSVFKVSFNYYFMPNVAMSASYTTVDRIDQFIIGGRYSF